MSYWIEAHYPPLAGDTKIEYGIWIQDGKQRFAGDLAKGDYVLIYQSKKGKNVIREELNGKRVVRSQVGREGLIAITEVTGTLYKDDNIRETTYTDGVVKRWCWRAPTKVIHTNGYVHRRDVNSVIGYDTNYTWFGFGKGHAGIIRISEEQFNELVRMFNSNARTEPSIPKIFNSGGHKRGNSLGCEESEAHRKLKEYVAKYPELVLNEQGIRHIATEFAFDTNDRADIVLEDRFGRIIGLEVEVDVSSDALEGVLQAVKYRRMLEVVKQKELGQGRSVLVAYSIAPAIKEICSLYEVEIFTVDRAKV